MSLISEQRGSYTTRDLRPGSDGKPVRVVGPWALEKLNYLQRYALIFNRGMKYRWRHRVYIDLFCGPGLCSVRLRGPQGREVEGSPLVAVNCAEPFTGYIFNDLEPSAIEALRQRLEHRNLQAQFLDFECNDQRLLEQIGSAIQPGALSLALIDPTNWQINFSTVEALTRGRRMDLVITFHTGGLKRVARRWPEILDEFFGGPEWQPRYREVLNSGLPFVSRTLLDLYESKLRSIGYRAIDDDILIRNIKEVPLYHLIFASKSPRGLDFWKKSTLRGLSGQQRML